MQLHNRRSFVRFLAGIPFLSYLAAAAGDDRLPPDHRPVEKPSRDVTLTPDMVVGLTARNGEFEIFSGRTKDLNFGITAEPGTQAYKRKFPTFSVTNLLQVPAGELTVDGLPLSTPGSAYYVYVTIDDLRCPGVSGTSVHKFHQMREDALGIKDAPNMLIKVQGGPTILLEGVMTFSSDITTGGQKNQKFQRLSITAKTATRLE